MDLARETTIQKAELADLRSGRVALQQEVQQAQVEAAAEVARLERERRELSARLEKASEALEDMAPVSDLLAERAAKERYLRAYKTFAEQSARCAGSEVNAARFELEAATLAQRLALTEAALAAQTEAAEERAKALDSLQARIGADLNASVGTDLNASVRSNLSATLSGTGRSTASDGREAGATPRGGGGGARGTGGGGGVSRSELYQLEGRVQSLQISEASAISRAEAAERGLEDVLKSRQELSERLMTVEEPTKPNPEP